MKIFCIGLNKTGTTTLGQCLHILGFRHQAFDLSLLEQAAIAQYDQLNNKINLFDSFSDWPYPLLYKYLDRSYPGSRFILTRRSTPEQWLKSLFAHSLRTDPFIGTRARSLAYGYPYPHLNPHKHITMYQQHLLYVKEYFADRPADLLELCWEQGSKMNDLCQFLGLQYANHELPHSNKGSQGNSIHTNANLRLLKWYKAKLLCNQ
jgi:hypothetical protein